MRTKGAKQLPRFMITEVIQNPIFERESFKDIPVFKGFEPVQLKLDLSDKDFLRLQIMLNNNPDADFKLVPYVKQLRKPKFDGAEFNFDDVEGRR